MKRFLVFVIVCVGFLVAAVDPGVALAKGPKEPPGHGPKEAPKGAIYDSTLSPLPGNLPSEGAEAYSFTEFGDEVTFAGSDRLLRSVTVTMSSWACQTGHWYDDTCLTSRGATYLQQITFAIYAPATTGDILTAGALLATATQTFAIPYRPSADDANCTGGRWFDKKEGCFNGLASNITFDFKGPDIALPDTVVYGISYNTSHYGPDPIGETAACFTASGGCFYDSLNIALGPDVSIGSKPYPDTVFQNAVYAGDYCDNGADGVGTMRLDSRSSACWAGYVPAVIFIAEKGKADKDK